MYGYNFGSYGYGVGISTSLAQALIDYRDWNTTTSSEYVTDGVELVTNGGFDIDVSGWITASGGAITCNSGRLEIRRDGIGNAFPKALQKLSLEANSLYLVKATCISSTTGAYEVYMDTVREGGTISQSQVPIGTEIVRYITVTSSTGIMLSGAGFSLSNTDDVVVFDNISVQKVIQEPNKRYLKDVGSTPTYNASMYFGRGAYFNGVDQSITVPVSVNRAQGTSVCIVISDSSIANLGYVAVANTSTAHIVQYNGAYSIYDVSTGYYKALFTPTKNTHHICVTQVGTIGKMYVDGVFIGQTTLSNSSNPPAISIMGTQFGFVSGLLKDLFYFNKPLTQEEITQSYEQPEAFYAMAQADNTCVLNMPMCETDEYVRNMKSYPTESKLSEDFSTSATSFKNFNTGVSSIDDGLMSVTTSSSTNGVYTSFNTITGAQYLVRVKAVSNTDTYMTRVGAGPTPEAGIYTTEDKKGPSAYSFMFIAQSTTSYVYLRNLNASTTVYDYVYVDIVTGVYPITNYTSSVRDNAKKLQYGLQTCNFVRDSLGVIQSASNYLECDGVGYANTNYKFNLVDGCSFTMIIDETPTNYFFGNDTSAIVNTTSAIYLKLMGTVISTYGIRSGYKVFDMVYKNNVFKLYRNGVLVGSTTATPVVDTYDYYLGGRNNSGVISTSGLTYRLFKVHSKELTQAEITANYNSYAAKGLLS